MNDITVTEGGNYFLWEGDIMSREQRSNLAIGLILVLLGGWFLLAQFVPGMGDWLDIEYSWPLIVVGVGVLLFVIGLLTRTPDLAVPACIVGGIGCLLYWQNETGNWGSWAYAWALIPGFAGVGGILSGLLEGRGMRSFREGMTLIVISLVLFIIFGSIMGAFNTTGNLWPILLILLGVWLLVRAIWRRK